MRSNTEVQVSNYYTVFLDISCHDLVCKALWAASGATEKDKSLVASGMVLSIAHL